MAKKEEFTIGIDIGACCIKMVSYVKNRKTKSSLNRLHLVNLMIEEKIKRPEDVSEILLQDKIIGWLKEIPYKKASIRICYSASESNLFLVTIPKVSMKELSQTLFWELGPLLPRPVDEYDYKYQILKLEQDQYTILVGVYLKETLKQISKIFKKIGRKPDIVETETLAVVDLFLTEFDQLEEPVGLIQLGANHSNYAILSHDSHPSFLFNPFGGNELSNRISRDNSISFYQAEKLRQKINQVQKSSSVEKLSKNNTQEILKMLKIFAEKITRFNTHYQQNTESNLEKIYLTGGLLNDPTIADTIKKSPNIFKVPCEFWDPLSNYFPEEMIEPHYSYHFSSALGLALR